MRTRNAWMEKIVLIVSLAGLFSSPCSTQEERFRLGAEIFIERHLDELAGKRVGMIVNHTSVLPSGVHLVDTLLSLGIKVTALFSPEHGIRGDVAAGTRIDHTTDDRTGLPVYSLYGSVKAPTAEMLNDVDVLVFDIQDVGARFYTYYITMADAMQSAAQHGKRFIVLDRPNPINGIDVEGPILADHLQSAVGRFPLPIRHGLTIGELMSMMIGEGWIQTDDRARFTVVRMEGWNRTMWFDETGLPWIPPSPNMKSLATATVYPGTCLFEGTNVSEGRGTSNPFEFIGAPWIEGRELARQLNALNLSGIVFEPISFVPEFDRHASPNPKYLGQACGGVRLSVQNRNAFHPVETAIAMLSTIAEMYPKRLSYNPSLFQRLVGIEGIGEELARAGEVEAIMVPWREESAGFASKRQPYLLYEERE